ncbi:MAG: thiamine phosphate synthase [Spirochaetota bacterium]
MKTQVDYSLYLVTDHRLPLESMEKVVAEAVAGGVSCVQFRDKISDAGIMIKTAFSLKRILSDYNVPLIINDRVDIAMAVDADGVHLGQRDIPAEIAKKIMPPEMILGISVESVDDALRAESLGVDYIGVSPVFSTPTKTDTAETVGIEGLKAIRNASSLPIVAIGGINTSNAALVLQSGADSIAVVSAIMSARNPGEESRKFRSIINGVRQK